MAKKVKKAPTALQSRRGRKSKAKGAAWERRVCHALSLWVSEGKRDDYYWRSAMSGGRATVRSRRGRPRRMSAQAGDITATEAAGSPLIDVFYIECKAYEDLQLRQLFYGLEAKGYQLWDDPYTKARALGKIPLVVMKENQQQSIVFTTQDGVVLLFGAAWERQLLGRIIRPVKGERTEIFAFIFQSVLSRAVWSDVHDRCQSWGLLQAPITPR